MRILKLAARVALGALLLCSPALAQNNLMPLTSGDEINLQGPSGSVKVTAGGLISGNWRLDAVPRFDAAGRFLGHHARITRMPAEQDTTDHRGDDVRQALHELRTPLGALQGFAEIIQQQLFGPGRLA